MMAFFTSVTGLPVFSEIYERALTNSPSAVSSLDMESEALVFDSQIFCRGIGAQLILGKAQGLTV
jgi:hypothetical protein